MKKRSLILTLLLFGVITLFAQRTITGNVSSADDGAPLVGANLLVKGTSTGAAADVDGNFSLMVPEGATTLVVSYTGFITQEIVLGIENNINIILRAGAALDEVVVVGYGTQSTRFKVQSVAKVGTEKLQNRPVIGPQELLQGQAAGVQMVGNSGVLGSNATVRIRGAASINAGGDPLYVVDGVPLNDGASSALSTGQGGATLNPLSDINPNDIESLTVLKDAGAAAIYGSRGSNGVILITTKKGKAGVNKVNADFYSGWSEPTFLLDMMNASEFRTFEKAYNNRTFPETGFDWPNAVLQTGRINSYSMNFTGGNEFTQYYLGGSFLRQSNYAIGNDLDRLNGRFNFQHAFSKKFRFGANIGVSRAVNNRIGQENNTAAPLTSAYLQLPTVEPRDANGNYVNTGFIQNVLAREELGINDLITNRNTSNVFLTYDLLEGLSIRTDWGIDNVTTTETQRVPDVVSPGGSGTNDIRNDNKWLTTSTLNYDKQFGIHAINAVAGFSYETARFEQTVVSGSNFAADALRNVQSAANYRLKDRYILEGAVRRDGSSRFGADNRFGIFWAVSGGWILSEEAFLKNVSFINTLKLTASYGTTGNDRIGNFNSLGLFGSGIAFDYAGLPGVGPNQPANPNLKWEETAQFDVGLSVELFNRRLAIDVNYFIKNTSDLLLDFQLADPNGFATLRQNAGEMQNRGVDLNIQTTNVRTRSGFEWTTNLNVGFLTNEVTSLPSGSLDAQGNRFVGGTNQRSVVGYSVNTFYLPRYVGINAANGDAEWLDAAGATIKAPSNAARLIVGDAIPDFTGGFTNNFTYKGLDLGVFFNFTYGNDVFLGELNFTENPIGGFNKARKLLNYWTESNKEGAFAPAVTSATKNVFAQNSTLQLLDGSFLRLRNVTLGYTLKGSQVSTKVFQSARVYVMGQNLWTLRAEGWEGRGQDPEVGYLSSKTFQGQSFFTAPQARTITVGINATF
jgi:TonB-dependent starch-binding outer membrane protein SusC